MAKSQNFSESVSRRSFVATSAWATTAFGCSMLNSLSGNAAVGNSSQAAAQVLMPRDRVPLSFIIDDSTCLVNMGHFCTPQFAQAWPDRAEYQKPWQTWPREIPDAFVREFGQWCGENGVKGKYSIVPYPACVGWLDRELPGWTRGQLESSLELVRTLMLPNWDIHPEMITHTRIIDLNSGRPVEPVNASTMENSFPRVKISTDQLTAYLAYALRILKNCGLPCEGITTPGGFGNLMKPELSVAVYQAVRDVFQAELPHYFKYVREGSESTEPVLENLQNENTMSVTATVNVPAGTGDWFGGWQGDERPRGKLYLSDDGQSGRMAELIRRRSPALMLCHWPGMYGNGKKTGFTEFQAIVRTLNTVYRDQTIWMKLSEIARYWAAKSWTQFKLSESKLHMTAPIAAPLFTFRCPLDAGELIAEHEDGSILELHEVQQRSQLESGTWFEEEDGLVVCLNLPKGESLLRYAE